MIFVGRVRLAVRLADDLQDFVERVEDGLEPFEDVDARLQRLELVLEAGANHLEPEVQELPEDRRAARAARACRRSGFSVGTGTSG